MESATETRTRKYESLQEWMEGTGTNIEALAKLAGLQRPHLSKILSRSRRCSLLKALALSQVTGVPVENLVRWKGVPKRKPFEHSVKNEVEKCA